MHIIKDLMLMTFGYCLHTDLLKKLCLYLVILFAKIYSATLPFSILCTNYIIAINTQT